MLGTDGKGRGDGDVRQSIMREYLPDQVATGNWGRYPFVHVAVKYGSPGILGLEAILMIEHLKNIVGIPDRHLRRIGVVRSVRGPRLENIGKALLVLFRKTVGRPFGGCRFEIVEIFGFLLK